MGNAVTTWGTGDYPLMAQRLEPAASAAVDAAVITSRDRVVDVATGTGNAALLAAERSDRVVGVDFEPALLLLAEERARAAKVDVDWVLGNVEALPLPDHSADVVLSVFGVMYAAEHAAAAHELARLAAPGGRVVLASRVPGSAMPALGQVFGDYLPPVAAGGASPSSWGDPEVLATILGAQQLSLTIATREQLILRFASSSQAADFLMRTAGHVMSEQTRLVAEGRWSQLHQRLCQFVEQRGHQRAGQLVLPCDYLLAVAIKS